MAVPYTIKYTNIDSSNAIEAYIEEHLAKLDKVIDDNDDSALAQIEIEKTINNQNSGEIYRAEINLHVSGSNYYADEVADDIYAAIDLMRDKIVREVNTSSKKSQDLFRAGARKIKEMLRRE